MTSSPRRTGTRRSRCSSASTATRCRSSPTSAATRTSRSASRCCSASSSRRTSTRRTRAVSLQDFWRRWHMTLSRWLRDYLYIPLGGNRKGRLLTYRNLMLTMLLGGLWHGAAWTFVVWGGIHGVGLAIERALGWRPTVAPPRSGSAASSRSTSSASPGSSSAPTRSRAPARCSSGCSRRGDSPRRSSRPRSCSRSSSASARSTSARRARRGLLRGFGRLPVPAQAVTVAVCLMLINTLGPEGVAPFIYFRF